MRLSTPAPESPAEAPAEQAETNRAGFFCFKMADSVAVVSSSETFISMKKIDVLWVRTEDA